MASRERARSRPRWNPDLSRGAGQVRHWAPSSPHSTTSISCSLLLAPSTASLLLNVKRVGLCCLPSSALPGGGSPLRHSYRASHILPAHWATSPRPGPAQHHAPAAILGARPALSSTQVSHMASTANSTHRLSGETCGHCGRWVTYCAPIACSALTRPLPHAALDDRGRVQA